MISLDVFNMIPNDTVEKIEKVTIEPSNIFNGQQMYEVKIIFTAGLLKYELCIPNLDMNLILSKEYIEDYPSPFFSGLIHVPTPSFNLVINGAAKSASQDDVLCRMTDITERKPMTKAEIEATLGYVIDIVGYHGKDNP